jgi:putative pyruvate formate lyase activating enzyme
MCNLRCVFCQNYDISQAEKSAEVGPAQLASLMLKLQDAGCHNINFVTPEHVVPQIMEALPLAVEAGLRLPIVYNTSAYDSMESLRLLDGVVDIYMPDFKFWDSKLSLRYLIAKDYAEAACRVIKEMYRQVGPLKFDENGLAKRGVLVRHLVMPGLLSETRQIFSFLAQEIGPELYINIMDQYYPAGRVSNQKFPEINRGITTPEFQEAVRLAHATGFRLDERRPRGLM